MALTKEKKQEVVEEVKNLLDSSKMTVLAAYKGTSVKAMQQLRHDARNSGTSVKVFKNRLVIKALEANDKFSDIDMKNFKGQLLYAFNSEDEVAPAQVLFNFNKLSGTIEFVGAISADGRFIEAEEVKNLATLPSKEQLRAMVTGTLQGPISGFVGVVNGNLRGLITVLNARADLG